MGNLLENSSIDKTSFLKIVSTRDTKILKGDRLIIGGLAEKSEDILKILNG